MKNQFLISIIIYLLLVIIMLVTVIFIINHKKPVLENSTVFIWNDDEESIPMDGKLIKIEFTEDGIVYLAPVD